jgi:hypothetical protein
MFTSTSEWKELIATGRYTDCMSESDDSPRLQGGGARRLTLVCRPTPFVRGVAQKRARLKTTSVSHGTTLEHGRVFTHSPTLWNPAKRDPVENVHMN